MIEKITKQRILEDLLKSAYNAPNSETVLVNDGNEQRIAKQINDELYDGEINIVTVSELG
ncbi:MAG: hypothetical protein COB36_08390 [Alphaproteobacteria bacterium]|nr:MAG: hypothetical protein COB36_08390 [Alphaproteobacteria bacterium]